jgi:hypothetical protein
MFFDSIVNFFIGIGLCIMGTFMIILPNRIFSLILFFSVIASLFNSVYLLFRFMKYHKKLDLLFSFFSIVFAYFLMYFKFIPQWILRTAFGAYSILCGTACLIQVVIDKINEMKGLFFNFLYAIIYVCFGFYLLLNPNFHTNLLMQAFGIYFLILGSRYVGDGYESVNPLTKYKWRRKIRISLPAFVCAIIPDVALVRINRFLENGKPDDLYSFKQVENVRLKVIVHVGKVGFQKVGHICFSFDDIVYSYGNYDSDSFRWNKTLGDGVFFTVPLEVYIPNMLDTENNSIFEYGIYTTDEQNKMIQEQIHKLKSRCYRWYCNLEKEVGYDDFKKFEADYPSRLHYRTGAKFYKIKYGKFHIYWALGDNCASFTDKILGTLGSDVLSVRGIISPGTYLDWLQKEYLKMNSPIVFQNIYTKE